MQPTPPAPPPARPVPYARRAERTGRDMAISLVVLLIPVAFLVVLFRLRGGEDVAVVDPSDAIAEAQATRAFPVAVPHGLRAGWRPVTALFRRNPDVLRLGYVTLSGGAVQLIESNEAVDVLVKRELGDPIRPAGSVAVADQSWQAFQVRVDERALVWTRADRTLIVIGRADEVELEALAAAVM